MSKIQKEHYSFRYFAIKNKFQPHRSLIDPSFGKDVNPPILVEHLNGEVHSFLIDSLPSHTRHTATEREHSGKYNST